MKRRDFFKSLAVAAAFALGSSTGMGKVLRADIKENRLTEATYEYHRNHVPLAVFEDYLFPVIYPQQD